MTRGLVIGEALIDICRMREITAHVGGSPLNVAVGLARLGRDVDSTHIADDRSRRRIGDYVEASGACLVPGSASASRTPAAGSPRWTTRARSLKHSILNGSSRGHLKSVRRCSYTPGLSPPCVIPADRPSRRYSTPIGVSATVTFDPDVRPSLIKDRDLARERIEQVVERSAIVKVSDEDLRWIDPEHEPEWTARTWLASGPAIVALTMGDHGSLGYCAAGQVRVAARPVQVVDTVGAGDAFMVGLLDTFWELGLLGADRRGALGQIELDALTTALEAASLSSALTVARAGADLPDRAALQAQSSSPPGRST